MMLSLFHCLFFVSLGTVFWDEEGVESKSKESIQQEKSIVEVVGWGSRAVYKQNYSSPGGGVRTRGIQ